MNDDLLTLFTLLLMLFYNAGLEASRLKGSIGKVACKLCVVNTKGEGITFATALGRNLGKLLSSMVIGMGFLRVLWNAKRQGWHDELARCYVIRRK